MVDVRHGLSGLGTVTHITGARLEWAGTASLFAWITSGPRRPPGTMRLQPAGATTRQGGARWPGSWSTARQRPLDGVPLHTNALDFLRGLRADRAPRRAAPRASAAPARCWSPAGADGTAPPSGRRSTPAWSRPPRSTARRSSPPRGSARPADLHPVQHEMAVRGGSQCGYCTPGFVCSMAAEFYRAGRRRPTARRRADDATTAPTASTCTRSAATCAGAPATGRSGTRPTRSASRPATTRSPPAVRRPPPARRPTRLTTPRPGSSGRPISPRRWRCSPSTPTPPWSPAAPTGASRSTSRARRAGARRRGRPAARAARLDRRRRQVRDRRRADPDRGRAPARRAVPAARRRCSRSSPRG